LEDVFAKFTTAKRSVHEDVHEAIEGDVWGLVAEDES